MKMWNSYYWLSKEELKQLLLSKTIVREMSSEEEDVPTSLVHEIYVKRGDV